MAATTLQILQGLETRLETISGLRAYDLVDGTPNAPCALILPDDINYHQTMSKDGFLTELELVVHCIEARADRSAQKRAYAWADPTTATSVRKAIEADRTLGGLGVDVVVSRARVGFFDENGLAYFGARFDVTVLNQ